MTSPATQPFNMMGTPTSNSDLINSPFAHLDVSVRATKEEVMASADRQIIANPQSEAFYRACGRQLITSRQRLRAELRWFSDIAPGRARKLYQNIFQGQPPQDLSILAPLSRSVVAAHFCHQGYGETFPILLHLQPELSTQYILDAINENRRIASMPLINSDILREELDELRKEHAAAGLVALRSGEDPIARLGEILRQYNQFQQPSQRFVTDMTHGFRQWYTPELQKLEGEVQHHIALLKEGQEPFEALPKIRKLLTTIDARLKPLQRFDADKQLDEPFTRRIAEDMRNVSLWLANERRDITGALALTEMLEKQLQGLPNFRPQIRQDIARLKQIVLNNPQMGKKRANPAQTAKAIRRRRRFLLAFRRAMVLAVAAGCIGVAFWAGFSGSFL